MLPTHAPTPATWIPDLKNPMLETDKASSPRNQSTPAGDGGRHGRTTPNKTTRGIKGLGSVRTRTLRARSPRVESACSASSTASQAPSLTESRPPEGREGRAPRRSRFTARGRETVEPGRAPRRAGPAPIRLHSTRQGDRRAREGPQKGEPRADQASQHAARRRSPRKTQSFDT